MAIAGFAGTSSLLVSSRYYTAVCKLVGRLFMLLKCKDVSPDFTMQAYVFFSHLTIDQRFDILLL
ncbi:hypothetical protein KY285_033468 [Solanum tuberosum]|nr:hypothetical protein KY285_033468 [Solanum tuberosum]